MSRLLDTHALYWFLFAPERLPAPLLESILTSPEVSFSIVSLWEMALKRGSGKLDVSLSFRDIDRRLTEFYLFKRMDILPHHLDTLASLPTTIHKDPFDRLLVAQAIAEDMTFVTRDAAISGYPVRTEWQ